jgi:hypothetical protein
MRIIRGGLLLVHNGGKNYTVKDDDEKAIGMTVSQVPLTLTKPQIIKMLQEYNVDFKKSDSKKRLMIKLNILYNYHSKY